MFVYLSVCLSPCLSFYLSICIMCVFIKLYVCLPVYHSTSLSVSVHLYLSFRTICLCVCPHQVVCLSVPPSRVCLGMLVTVCLCVCLFVLIDESKNKVIIACWFHTLSIVLVSSRHISFLSLYLSLFSSQFFFYSLPVTSFPALPSLHHIQFCPFSPIFIPSLRIFSLPV